MIRLRATALIAALAVCLTGAAAASELVVIASTRDAPSLGTRIDGAAILDLPKGAAVTLVSAAGKVVRFEGPWRGAPDPATGVTDGSLLGSLAKILLPHGPASTALAGFRSGPRAPASSWSIDVHRIGTQCTTPQRPPVLWRATARGALTVLVETPDDNERVSWRPGEHTAPWPRSVPLLDGGDYRLRMYPGGAGEPLRILVVPAHLASDASRAAWMAANDCVRQARLLLNEMADAAEARAAR